MSEIIEAELVPAVDEKLVKYAGQTGLEKPATETLMEAFRPVFLKARDALADAVGVAASVKDATCVTEIKKSRACRLAIRAVRLEGETVHKKQKESALRFGRAVDGFRNILLADLEPVEQSLQEAEDTAERAEAARKAKLKAEREAELVPLMDGVPLAVDLSTLEHGAYARLLSGAHLMRQAKIDAAAKMEADRLAKEKADREERERMAAENARLQAEAAEARRLAEIERARVEAERAEERKKAAEEAAHAAKAARVEREAMQAEAAKQAEKERREREAIAAAAREQEAKAAKESFRLKAELASKEKAEKEQAERVEAERREVEAAKRAAAAAPDKAKLKAFAVAVRQLPIPELSEASGETGYTLAGKVEALAAWAETAGRAL